jgi:tetratricopeptide (TPR) repeat protein
VQDQTVHLTVRAALMFAEERYAEIIETLESQRAALSADAGSIWLDLYIAEAALAMGDSERAASALTDELLSRPDAGPIVQAQATRFRAAVAADRGEHERAQDDFKRATASFREYGTPFELACTELEHAEWLVSQGRTD